MKLTHTLWKQHLGRMTRRHWLTACHRIPVQTNAENCLKSLGISVEDSLDIIKPKDFTKIELPEKAVNDIKYDETHPNWKERKCLMYKDKNVLQNGVKQAQLLTNTVEIKNELPEKICNLMVDHPKKIENLVQRAIQVSNIYDAYQEKLPVVKDPERPSWNFPRNYGLPDSRKSSSLVQKLFQLSELVSSKELVQKRIIIKNGITSCCIEKESDILHFDLTVNLMITSENELLPIENPEIGKKYELPSLYPMHPTIGLSSTNIYRTQTLYPVNPLLPQMNVHTIFVDFNTEEVKNLTELSVTEDQILARSLIKSFTTAACYAKVKFGEKVKDLPHPITVQCIHSYTKNFHFSVYQLNTLNLDGTNCIKNFWWNEPMLHLFEEAGYNVGKPTFTGYNPEIFKRICAFYSNT